MAETSSAKSDIKLVVVTPEATALDVTAEFVALPLYDGEIGIGRGHAPLIGRLGFGELRYTFGGETTMFYVDGGFVQVQDNNISVLTNRSLEVADIDMQAAEEQLAEALTRVTYNPDEEAIRERLIHQARAQIRMAVKR